MCGFYFDKLGSKIVVGISICFVHEDFSCEVFFEAVRKGFSVVVVYLKKRNARNVLRGVSPKGACLVVVWDPGAKDEVSCRAYR